MDQKTIKLALESKDFGKVDEPIKDLNYYKDFVAQRNEASNWKEFVEKTKESFPLTYLSKIDHYHDVAAEMFAINEVNKTNDYYPQVIKFAKYMQFELKANEPKKGIEWMTWNDTPKMFDELEYHEDKLLIAMTNKDTDKIREYLADCGNILMFIGNAYKLYD